MKSEALAAPLPLDPLPLEKPPLEKAPGDSRAPVKARPAAKAAPARNDATRAAILSGPILPTLIKLALPTMVVLLAQTAVNIAAA